MNENVKLHKKFMYIYKIKKQIHLRLKLMQLCNQAYILYLPALETKCRYKHQALALEQ